MISPPVGARPPVGAVGGGKMLPRMPEAKRQRVMSLEC